MDRSTSSQPLVSVVIPLYNCEAFAAEAIQSVLAQTYKNFEIIVVNDGSTDGSAAAVRPFREKIRYIEQKNSGSAVARNSGVNMAKGELIAFLDADDVWLPHRLEAHVEQFQLDPKLGLAHSDRVLFDSATGQEFPEDDFMHLKGRDGYILRELFEYNFICTQSVMMRKACFDAVGLFDSNFRAAQDYDLWLRTCEKYKARYIPGVVTRYRIHSGQISWKFDLSYESEKRVIEKFVQTHTGDSRPYWLTDECIQARLSELYYRFGHDCFHYRKLDQARNVFRESLKYNSKNYKAFAYWALASYAPGLVLAWDRVRGRTVQPS